MIKIRNGLYKDSISNNHSSLAKPQYLRGNIYLYFYDLKYKTKNPIFYPVTILIIKF